VKLTSNFDIDFNYKYAEPYLYFPNLKTMCLITQLKKFNSLRITTI
jgi:hypothetical protein